MPTSGETSAPSPSVRRHSQTGREREDRKASRTDAVEPAESLPGVRQANNKAVRCGILQGHPEACDRSSAFCRVHLRGGEN